MNQLIHLAPSINRPVPMPAWKRVFDVVCCLAAVPILALFSLAIGIMIKVSSPGPIFFRQERVGFRNRRFMCYKFRTMVAGAESKLHQQHCGDLIHSNAPLVKLDARRDARIIPGGWLLRASGLDELPQLFNVLRGDMSLVGPRPCIPYEHDQFLPRQQERSNAYPGLTGLWQVSGKNRTTFEEMIHLDIHYAQNVSWWLDLKIIVLTAPALFLQISDIRRARRPSSRGTSTFAAGRYGATD